MLVALLGVWEVYVDAGGVSSLVLPAPHAVAAALYDDRGTLLSNLWVTAREIVLGIVLAAIVALLAATLIHFSTLGRRALYPLLIGSQAVPIVIVAPVLVVWLGFGLLPKLAIIAPGLVLPAGRDDAGGRRAGRSGAAEADAHARFGTPGGRSRWSSCPRPCRAS